MVVAGVFTQEVQTLTGRRCPQPDAQTFDAPRQLAPTSHLTAALLTPAVAPIGVPTIQSIAALVAVGNLPGAQAGIGLPTLRQRQTLTAVSVATFPPDIQTPKRGQCCHCHPPRNAATLTPASAVFAPPPTGQLQTLIAVGLVDRRKPQFSTVVIGGTQLLDPFPGSIVTASPEIGVGDLNQGYPPGTKFITLVTPARTDCGDVRCSAERHNGGGVIGGRTSTRGCPGSACGDC